MLKRSKKHRVYELPDGQNIVMSATPGDHRAGENQLRDVRRALGIKQEPKPMRTAPRRDKKPPQRPVAVHAAPCNGNTLADQLRRSGAEESVLRTKISELQLENGVLKADNDLFRGCNEDFYKEIDELASELGSLKSYLRRCPVCRLRRWWSSKIRKSVVQ
jgi:hypothetical protein